MTETAHKFTVRAGDALDVMLECSCGELIDLPAAPSPVAIIKAARDHTAPANTDPRKIHSGGIAGPGGPQDVGEVVLDTRYAIVSEGLEVALVDPEPETRGKPLLAMAIRGRISRTQDRAQVMVLLNEDGAAAIATELIALAYRIGPEFGDSFLGRLVKLVEEGAVGQGFQRPEVIVHITAVKDPNNRQELAARKEALKLEILRELGPIDKPVELHFYVPKRAATRAKLEELDVPKDRIVELEAYLRKHPKGAIVVGVAVKPEGR